MVFSVIALVKVTFKPIEEVIIHDSVHYPLETLVKLTTINVNPGARTAPLTWAKGVAFSFISLLPDTSETVAEDLLEGKIHWFNVEWTIMPQYQKEIEVEQTKVTIPLADLSANPLFCEVADALKQQTETPTKPVKIRAK
jgi:hypothetical protein